MTVTIKRVLGACTGCLLWVSAASAANTIWDFPFEGGSFSQANTPVQGFGVGLRIAAPQGFSGTFTTPDALQQGSFTKDFGNGVSLAYADFSQLQAASIDPTLGTYSLSVNSTGGPSIYHFAADFSGVPANAVPQITITSPLADSTTTNPQPTFQWSLTGGAPAAIVTITNPDFTVNENFFGLDSTKTSFTQPTDLPPGTYSFFVELSSAAIPIPIHTTLISGPDLGITPNGTFQFVAEAFENFTVVPEPTTLGLVGLLSPMFLRRRRGRGADRSSSNASAQWLEPMTNTFRPRNRVVHIVLARHISGRRVSTMYNPTCVQPAGVNAGGCQSHGRSRAVRISSSV
jgi:hypothetical protein